MGSRTEKIKKKVTRRKKIIILSIVSVLLLSALTYALLFYFSFSNMMNKVHVDKKKSSKRAKAVSLEKLEPISILLMGVEAMGKGDKGRSDTMIVVTINPKLNTVKMLSIPRDTRVEIPGHKGYTKINSAFSLGGADLTIKTVENLLDIPIDYFAQINFEGFTDMVNALGGITVDNPYKIWIDNITFPKGKQHLDGDYALVYVRIRKSDPRGDYGRQERQRTVIKQIVQDSANFSSFTKFQSIFKAVGKNVKTNLSLEEMWKLRKNYSGAINNIESMQVKAIGKTINGGSYQLILHDEQVRLINLLREHLGLPLKDESAYKNIDADLLKGQTTERTGTSSNSGTSTNSGSSSSGTSSSGSSSSGTSGSGTSGSGTSGSGTSGSGTSGSGTSSSGTSGSGTSGSGTSGSGTSGSGTSGSGTSGSGTSGSGTSGSGTSGSGTSGSGTSGSGTSGSGTSNNSIPNPLDPENGTSNGTDS